MALLGAYALAVVLGFRWADRLLGPLVRLLELQWATAALVNVVGGAALVLLGGWAVGRPASYLPLLGLPLIAFGIWRCWVGIAIFRAMR